MHRQQNSKMSGLVDFLPLILGCTGLLYCVAHTYFDKYSLHNLKGFDALRFGAVALADMVGILFGFVILRIQGQRRIIIYGIIASIMAFVWQAFFF